MNLLPIILTIIGSIFALIVVVIGAAWQLRGLFAKVEGEMIGFREVMMAMNRRIERLESKLS